MMGLPTFVRRQLGAASSPSTDLISPPPPKQDMGKDNLGGGLWKELVDALLFQPYHQCLCHFVFS